MRILYESTQSPDKSTVYEVVKDGEVLDVFNTEKEAINHAKNNNADSVVIAYHIDGPDGNLDNVEEGDTVWTPDMRESLNEAIEEEDRIQALADYLGIDPEEISNTYDYEYETPEGDYLVVTEDEAWNLARQDIISIFEDLGLEAFTENFREWIIENALDVNEFESVVEDPMYDYIEEIREVEDDTYGTELIASMIDAGCIDEEDLDDPEFDVDDHTEDYLSYLMDGISDDVGYVDWCIDNYDEDWVTNYAIENDLFDMDTIVEECIDVDGIAHFIARYDGEEIELEDGLYAYRTN